MLHSGRNTSIVVFAILFTFYFNMLTLSTLYKINIRRLEKGTYLSFL